MRNPFKKHKEYIYIGLKGKVRVLHKGKIQDGVIFGRPMREVFRGNYYHVIIGDNVYDIPEHAIEEIKAEKSFRDGGLT